MGARRMVLLVAGMGTRLKPHAQDIPKCLVPLHQKPLLGWQMAAAKEAGITEFRLVGGYQAQLLAGMGAPVINNPAYQTTNMVESLWCAREAFDQDVLISYGDILCSPRVIRALADAPYDISVAVDTAWQGYWRQRFDDPLKDAESLRLSRDGRISSIGRKAASLSEIQAQYIGLLRLSPAGAKTLLGWYGPRRDQDKMMFMTDLLQASIDRGVPVHAVPVDGGWLEIDTPRDLKLAEEITSPRGEVLKLLR